MTHGQQGNLVARCTRILDAHWVDELGYCVPNPNSYPHLWLWDSRVEMVDSCFHSIAWVALKDKRALRELNAALANIFSSGFLPHMVYRTKDTIARGPRRDVSSFTQPPVFAHALRYALRHKMAPDAVLVQRAISAVNYLWEHRRKQEVLFIVHPWESGADNSPRWDSWNVTSPEGVVGPLR